MPAFFVILLAPTFAWLWIRMGSKQPSSPTKFAIGLLELPTLFGFVAATTIVAGVVLALLVPRIRTLMGGVH